MERFAHIFIGNEFAEIVSNISRQICKYGGEDTLSSVNMFVVDEKNIRQLLFPERTVTVKDVVLKPDPFEFTWKETGQLSNNLEKDRAMFVSEIFDKLLTMANAGSHASLNVVLHFPLYKAKALDTAKSLYSAIKGCGRPVELDFLGYCDDLAQHIEPSYVIKSPAKNQIADFVAFRESEGLSYNEHFIAIQNSSQTGISLGLDQNSLASILRHFVILFAHSYHEIFPKTMEYRDVVALGVSSLYLDKYFYAECLFNRAMLKAMENVHLDSKANATDAYALANSIFEDKATLLSTLFGQIDTQEVPEFRAIQENFVNEINTILERKDKVLSEQKSITMQAAILAACLAKPECELFEETVFYQDLVNIDKLFDECINYYISSDKAQYYKIDGKLPVNPIKQLSDLNTRLIQSATTVRTLKSELEELAGQIGESEKATDCYIDDNYYHFRDQKFRLLPSIEQEPLKETYTAHEVKATSLDLRSKFTSIKNQGQQGSCLSFTLTSIFEYTLQLHQAQAYDLSESFLYYNARDLDGDGSVNEDNGSRFKPSIDSLAKYGIALEKVWPYNENVYSQKPSEAAYADAATRKLISAANVNLTVADIKSALSDGCPVAGSFVLTQSFCDQGWAGGYISMPTEAEIAAGINPDTPEKRHSRHAMVIVGFSDELKMFIVRNSWGDNWGDKGYCYVPYSYIEHKDLFDYACIITGIENLQVTPIEITDPLTVDTSALNIQFVIKRNELYDEERQVEKLRNEIISLRSYFELEKQMYCNQNKRDSYIEANKEVITAEQEELRQDINDLNLKHEDNDKSYKTYTKEALIRSSTFLFGTLLFAVLYKQLATMQIFSLKAILAWAFVCLALVAASVIFRSKTYVRSFWMSLCGVAGVFAAKTIFSFARYFAGNGELYTYFKDFFWKSSANNFLWLVAVLVVALVILLFESRRRWREWRDERDRIDYEINKIQQEINAKEREKELFRLKAVSAWDLVSKLQKLYMEFHIHHTNLIFLINNLRIWQKDLKGRKDNVTLTDSIPDTPVLSSGIMDKFFDDYLKDSDDLKVDFCTDISKYQNTLESLNGYKAALIERIVGRLMEHPKMSEFDMSNHIVSGAYASVAQVIEKKTLASLDERAGIFLNVDTNERGVIIPNTMVFAPLLNICGDELRKKAGNHTYIESPDKYRITYLKVATLWFRECFSLK